MDKTKQGDIGVAAATMYYTLQGHVVLTPNTERIKYDLVIDRDGQLLRVQVKTSGFYKNGAYVVQLRTNGANYTTKSNITRISEESADLLFVYTMDGKHYEIPTNIISGMNQISLGKTKYSEYLVGNFSLVV